MFQFLPKSYVQYTDIFTFAAVLLQNGKQFHGCLADKFFWRCLLIVHLEVKFAV